MQINAQNGKNSMHYNNSLTKQGKEQKELLNIEIKRNNCINSQLQLKLILP